MQQQYYGNKSKTTIQAVFPSSITEDLQQWTAVLQMIIMRLLRCVNPGRLASIFSSWMSGSVEIVVVGVSIAIFNQVSKICIYPLVSVTTSFVAEENAIMNASVEEVKGEDLGKACAANAETKELPPHDDPEKTGGTISTRFGGKHKHIPSVSSALIVGGVLGLLHAIGLIFATKLGSPMLAPALRYLKLRSLGAPAVLLSSAMQGFTPVIGIVVAGDVINIILDPILMFVFHMGVSGAVIAHVSYNTDTAMELSAESKYRATEYEITEN
ncbi:MatE [Musa troglodytarum]|uniref:MatE n=1 Tax=Musa troglodytarum TaxID=320322 RepID=A0A9E7GUJ6_9LILI|nr:MatE [Musa troglodytarum]